MRRPGLSGSQRLQVARLAGHVQWLVVNGGAMTADQAVADVRRISTDSLVLGQVLGDALEMEDQPPTWPALLSILRTAGADEVRAEDVAAWQRWRLGQRDASEGHPVL